MTLPHDEALLAEQIAYYRARAEEYDDWFLRRGSYDRGAERNRAWFSQVEEVRVRLDAELSLLPEGGRVLELACGTGLWTERLAAHAAGVDAVDAAPEVIRLNRERLCREGLERRVEHTQADLFEWRPERRYPLVFFGFWLSHVPSARFESFWRLIEDCLDERGRFFFVDNLRTRTHPFSDQNGERARRTLADGRAFEIVKIFHEPEALERRLAGMGWQAEVRATEDFFLFGSGDRA